MRIVSLAYGFLLLASVGCREGPTGPDATLVVVEGSTATHEGIDLRFQRFNLSWYPEDDSPHPSDGEVFATLLIEVTNHSDTPRPIRANEFALRTLSNELPFHAGPTWTLHDGGRAPRVEGVVVQPGESLEGWLTFEVPRGLLPEELLWSPTERVAFALEVRWWLSTARTQESRLFGYVRDAEGSPVPGVPLTITPLETVPGIPGAETTVGDCTGVLHEVREAVTDASGRYEVIVGSIHSDELCIDVHPDGNTLHRVSGDVSPGNATEVGGNPGAQTRSDDWRTRPRFLCLYNCAGWAQWGGDDGRIWQAPRGPFRVSQPTGPDCRGHFPRGNARHHGGPGGPGRGVPHGACRRRGSTEISHELAEEMIGGGRHVLAYLQSPNRSIRLQAEQFLRQIIGQDYGDDVERWEEWIASLSG